METTVEISVKDNYSRFKSASWFNKLKGRDILVVGCGGIASWLSLLLARVGVNMYIFDEDLIEAHNQSGQLFKNNDIGKLKVKAISNIISEFCDNEVSVEIFEEMYTEWSSTNPIVMTGLDNMKARKIVFTNWIKHLEENPKEKDIALLIDGRLNAESFSIFCVKGNDLTAIENYKKEALFDDSEVEEQLCSLKQTSHMAACVASHMVGFLTNAFGEEFREIPYFYRYDLPINFTTNDYVG